MDQEKQLVAMAKEDPARFGEIYDKYFDAIYRYVARRVKDNADLQDLVSQTFYDALSHLDRFEWRGYSFGSWLYKIAHNNVLKYYKAQTRAAMPIEEGREIVDVQTDVKQEAVSEELKNEVERALDQLEPEEREIVKLKFFEEATNVEIAEIMGLSANHIGVKVFRVLKKVKQLLS